MNYLLYGRILRSKFVLTIYSSQSSRALLKASCHAGFVVPRAASNPPNPTPLHVSHKGRVFQISHRHSMTLFADETMLSFHLLSWNWTSLTRGEAAYLKAKCDRAEVIDVLARQLSGRNRGGWTTVRDKTFL
jgi:hypothetical protein